MLLKKIGKKLPVIEPDMKLTPTIKLIGKAIVSVLNKLTFLLLELFCMPIINNKNKQELKVIEKINLLNASDIFYIAQYISNINYKLYFWNTIFFARYLDAEGKFKPALINSLSSFFIIIRFIS